MTRFHGWFLGCCVMTALLAACGGGSSPTTTTTQPTPPQIATQPVNQTVSVGQSATFGVAVTGTALLRYQWSKSGTAITGATGSSYSTPATVSGDNGSSFAVIVSNAAGSVTSNAAVLTVSSAPPVAPQIATQPANQTVSVGQSATFSVAATGTAPLQYQWYKSGVAIFAATGASYTTPATVSGDNGSSFAVVVSNAADSVTSNAATLTVTSAPPTAPRILTQPVNQAVSVGGSATFSVAATGTAPLHYQWAKAGTAIVGATGPSYSTPATASADNGSSFSAMVSNVAGSVMSNPATLTVTAAAGTDVVTYKYDVARTGQNVTESLLTLSNVTSATFGLLSGYCGISW